MLEKGKYLMPRQPFAGEQCGRDHEDCGWIELAALTHYPEEIGDWSAVLSVNIWYMHTASLTRLVDPIGFQADTPPPARQNCEQCAYLDDIGKLRI